MGRVTLKRSHIETLVPPAEIGVSLTWRESGRFEETKDGVADRVVLRIESLSQLIAAHREDRIDVLRNSRVDMFGAVGRNRAKLQFTTPSRFERKLPTS